MANIYSWEISQFKAKIQEDDKQNVIYQIYYVFITSDGEENPTIVRQMGLQTIEYNPEDNFIPYEDLTKEDVVGWLEQTANVEHLKEKGDELLYNKKNPIIETLYPNWNDPV